jgi:UDP-glucuronate decarboxylase
VVELTGSRAPIERRPLPEDDPRQRQPDIAQARKVLDWEPKTPLRQGLTHTIAYFDRLLSEGAAAAAMPAPPLKVVTR